MSKRQAQVNELLRRNMSLVFQEAGLNIYGREPMVSVTHVIMSPDLALAKIYLSIFNAKDKELVMDQINQAMPELRQHLFTRIRKQIRRMPDFVFYLDDTMEAAWEEEKLFETLYANNQMGSEEE